MILFLFFLFTHFVFAQNYPFLISEIMHNPQGNDSDREWIEVVNVSNNSFNVFGGRNGWRINDGSNHLFENISLTLNPGEVLIIAQDKNKFLQEYPNFRGKIIQANFSLKNKSGTIQIYDQNKNLITQTTYLNSYGGDGNGYSIIFQNVWKESKNKGGNPGIYPDEAKEINVQDNKTQKNFQNNNQIQIEQNTTTSSRQHFEQNNISNADEKTTFENVTFQSTTNFQKSQPKTLIISEFFPNPEGNDYQNEFVELYNYGKDLIDLKDFSLKIGGKKVKLQGIIEPKEYFLITNKEHQFFIRNSGETLKIYYQDEPIFEISYEGKAPAGKSFSRFDKTWIWATPTPGEENKKESIEATFSKIIQKPKTNLEENSPDLKLSTFSLAQLHVLNDSSKIQNLTYLIGSIILIFVLSFLVVNKL